LTPYFHLVTSKFILRFAKTEWENGAQLELLCIDSIWAAANSLLSSSIQQMSISVRELWNEMWQRSFFSFSVAKISDRFYPIPSSPPPSIFRRTWHKQNV
jgi:hypothetical protein